MAIRRTNQRVVREKSQKRSLSWFNKEHELAWMTRADIYMVALHRNKFSTYKSTDQPG